MYITTIQQHVNAGDSQSIAKDGIHPDINCAPDTTDNVSSDDATPGVVYRTDDEILYSPTHPFDVSTVTVGHNTIID